MNGKSLIVLDLPFAPKWIVSDTHIGHRSMLAYYPWRLAAARNVALDFVNDQTPLPPTTEVMDRQIVNAWNDAITSDTHESVLFLGDLCVGAKHLDLAGKLRGKVTATLGNHDVRPHLGKLGWNVVEAVRFTLADGRRVLALHDPGQISGDMIGTEVDVILHGHLHGAKHHQPLTSYLLDRVSCGKLAIHDCSCDAWRSYAPRLVTDVVAG